MVYTMMELGSDRVSKVAAHAARANRRKEIRVGGNLNQEA
jgi:hypothetical protein